MKNFFGVLLKAYAVVAAYAVALLAIVAVWLFWTGALSGERVQAAWQTLKSKPAPAEKPVEKAPTQGIAERERILEQRTQELQKLEDRAATRLALIRAEQATLDQKREEAAAVLSDAKKAQEEIAQTKNEAELAANVPILSRMEPAGIVAVLRNGDDARFVRYLRALRPTKAAEVLDALRTDPQFEDEFRRVPSDAPAGSKSRFDRLSEEFRKSP